MRSFVKGTLICAAALLAPGVPLLAQGSTPPLPAARDSVVAIPARIIAINPLLPLLKSFSGEVEGRVSRAVTLGVSGSYFGSGDFYYVSSADLHFRYYPNEQAPAGFAIGATLGAVRSTDNTVCTPESFGTCGIRAGTAGAYGTDLSYNWLLGPVHRSFAVGIGVGVKRLTRRVIDAEVLPTLRLQVGYAF